MAKSAFPDLISGAGGARFDVCHFNEWACIISIPKWLQGHFPHKFAFALDSCPLFKLQFAF